ncbi:MAG: hypothetical protein ACLSHX_08020 [Suilimivivens sp.]|jgi:3-dehydroquinate synthase
MKQIKIKSSLYDYNVQFIDDVKKQIEQLGNEGKVTYVIDQNVYRLYPDYFSTIEKDNIYFVDAVEHKKNIETCMDLITFWQSIKLKKNWKVICFGGGITQDITTFASNIYLRNVEWYFFPTTLLAMSDSCIGGKCGINMGELKNQLGVFYPPRRIYICEKFLQTLSNADYINGWGEILKFSLTEKKEFYEAVENEKQLIPCPHINDYLYEGLLVKKKIIEEDEFEGDLRRILNYGHTFGHALEAYSHNTIPHGKGVIWGIDVANFISANMGILDHDIYMKIKEMIKKSFIKEEIMVEDTTRFMKILSTDKKVKNNTVYLILLKELSQLIIKPVEIDKKLEDLFKRYLEETHGYYCD